MDRWICSVNLTLLTINQNANNFNGVYFLCSVLGHRETVRLCVQVLNDYEMFVLKNRVFISAVDHCCVFVAQFLILLSKLWWSK